MLAFYFYLISNIKLFLFLFIYVYICDVDVSLYCLILDVTPSTPQPPSRRSEPNLGHVRSFEIINDFFNFNNIKFTSLFIAWAVFLLIAIYSLNFRRSGSNHTLFTYIEIVGSRWCKTITLLFLLEILLLTGIQQLLENTRYITFNTPLNLLPQRSQTNSYSTDDLAFMFLDYFIYQHF